MLVDQVIEYDNEFTKYDMPDEYFTKIKKEDNINKYVTILEIKKEHEDIDLNTDLRVVNYIKKFL